MAHRFMRQPRASRFRHLGWPKFIQNHALLTCKWGPPGLATAIYQPKRSPLRNLKKGWLSGRFVKCCSDNVCSLQTFVVSQWSISFAVSA